MVQVGNVSLGTGQPKICVSITETSTKAIIAAADILVSKHIDMIEWRIDYFDQINDWNMIEETLHRLDMSLYGKPLLVTYRTKQEGGQGTMTGQEYEDLLLSLAASGYVQMIDVEIFREITYEQLSEQNDIAEKIAKERELLQKLQKDVVLIGSYHNFEKTPSYEEMCGRLRFIAELGVDVPKMAVMPQCKKDVLTLMIATLEMSEELDKPLITMAMGGLGTISRMAGEAFHSAVTFGCLGASSAPGQIAVNHLEEMLDMIHQCYR